jgi:fructokinase
MDERMSNVLPIVFGEALVDAFADGPVPGGAPFNVACHLAALGCAPRLITRLGDDPAGAVLRRAASACGLSLQAAQHDRETARVIVHEHGHGHQFEIPPDQAFDRIDADEALAATRSPATDRWLYFGTLALRSPTSRAALAALRAEADHHSFVDLNWREAGPPRDVVLDLLQHVEVLKVSEEELARLLDWLGLPPVDRLPAVGDQRDAVAALCRFTGTQLLLVSLGADGAVMWDGQGRCLAHASAPPLPQRVDSVGAGDAFSAMMLAGLLCGVSERRLLGQAVAFASLSCGWRGALPDRTDLYLSWRSLLCAQPPAALPVAMG